MSTTGNEFIDYLTNAYSEAAKINADAMKKGFDSLRQTMSLPYDLSNIVSEGSSTLSKGFADYLRLNAEHASRLVDLSRTMSTELLSSIERSGRQTKTSATEQRQQGQTISELHLSGSPGDLCRSVFVLQSMKSASVVARVFHSRFVDQVNGAPVTIPVNFNPVEATIAPNEGIQIAVEVGIPEDTPLGTYQSMVWVEGFSELNLRVLLNVVESKKTEVPRKRKKTTPKPNLQTKVNLEKQPGV